MIIVKMMGNLGNQMFIYAMARSIALEYGEDLYIDLSGLKRYYYTAKYKLNSFNIAKNVFYNLKEVPMSVRLRYFVETSIFLFQHVFYRRTRKDLLIPDNIIENWHKKGNYFSTNRSFFDFSGNNNNEYKFIYGYFQSEKYFNKYAKEIKNELKVSIPISKIDEDLIKEMNNCNSVGVSIRANKTSEIENTKVQPYLKMGFITKDFYIEGMKTIAQKIDNPVFYIFSDNIDMVKREYSFPYPVKYVIPDDSATGMRLLCNCKHFVIANSTFSWWGAYLSDNKNKTIVMPYPWDKEGTPRECIYLKEAIRIPCKFE